MSGRVKKFQGSGAVNNTRQQSLTGVLQIRWLNMSALKSMHIILSLTLFISSFLLYANSLRNGYAIDDVEVITENTFVTKGLQGIPEILSTPHLLGYSVSANETYRPLSLVFFAVEYELFGANPAVGHFCNVLLFGICVVLLFLFLDNLFDRKKTIVAFIAAILFAAHPIHTEVVDNIKSFDELLCFFFAFLSLNIFMKYVQAGKINQLLTGILAMFLSLISKETSIVFIFIIPLIFFFYRNENKRRSLFISVGTLLAAISFLAVRAFVLKVNNNTTPELNVIENALVGAPGAASRIATAILVLGYYVKLLFIPYPLISDYSMNSIPYAHFTDVAVLLSLIAYVALIGIAGYRFYKFRKDPWAFGILFFLVSIALFSNLAFLIASQMSERFTFFASVGFCLLIALALDKWIIRSRADTVKTLINTKVFIILIPVLLMFSFITLGRNSEWIDNYTLHKSDLGKAPENSHLNYCVGKALVDSVYKTEQDPAARQQILHEGICYLRKSVEIDPGYSHAQTEIGYAFLLDHQYDSAEIHDRIALALNPADVGILNNISQIYFVNGNFSGALAVSLKIISMAPGYVPGYNNAGLCYYHLNKVDSGIIYLYKAISTDPQYRLSYANMALSYNATGKMDSAQKYQAIFENFDRQTSVQRPSNTTSSDSLTYHDRYFKPSM